MWSVSGNTSFPNFYISFILLYSRRCTCSSKIMKEFSFMFVISTAMSYEFVLSVCKVLSKSEELTLLCFWFLFFWKDWKVCNMYIIWGVHARLCFQIIRFSIQKKREKKYIVLQSIQYNEECPYLSCTVFKSMNAMCSSGYT